MKKLATFLLMVALVVTTAPSLATGSANEEMDVKNVIFMIGDGMGVNHVRVTEIYAAEVLGQKLAINGIEERTTTTTYSLSSQVTDSAASGSALHSGYKFENGAINVLPEGNYTFTLGQAAQAAGKSVGVVSTTRITHATPASVYGHVESRDFENELAIQLVEFAPDVVLGGGRRYFLPQSADGSRREDDRDLMQEMLDMGYVSVTNAEELAAVDVAETDRLVGLFTSSHVSYEIDRVSQGLDEPSLAEMTATALDILGKNDNGFFVMIEGGRIDHAAHAWDAKGVIYDTLAFDAAVQVALDFQAKHPDTLVVVTADHETGGLGLGSYTGYDSTIPQLESITCSMEYLNGQLGEDNGVEVAEACGIPLEEADVDWLLQHPANLSMEELEDVPGGYAYSWGHYVLSIVASDLGQIRWTTWSHTGQPVITYAVGPHAGMFEGALDNIDLPKIIAEVAGLTFEDPIAPDVMTD